MTDPDHRGVGYFLVLVVGLELLIGATSHGPRGWGWTILRPVHEAATVRLELTAGAPLLGECLQLVVQSMAGEDLGDSHVFSRSRAIATVFIHKSQNGCPDCFLTNAIFPAH
jgi:hypothetical protein